MTAPTQRRVSVIVPTCDRPALLRQALASIRALEGSDLTFEILVGDNGSAPETRTVAEEFGAIYLRADRRGAGAARNAGLRAATGDYLAFLDDDDVWLPTHVRGHLSLLEARPEFEAAVGQVVSTNPDLIPTSAPWPVEAPRDGRLFMKMISGYFPQIGATVARARVRESVGEFDESLIGDQDWDWHIRVARQHKVGFVDQSCVLFRQRASGSFDALQLRRLPYTRRVFFKNALPAWRRWSSPAAFLRSYFGAVQIYHNYFTDAAITRAHRGERRSALHAIRIALGVSPIRTVRQLLGATPLRTALMTIVGQQRARIRTPQEPIQKQDSALLASRVAATGVEPHADPMPINKVSVPRK